mmetsp:Transcript_28494/g.43083  ORF Transcript_28494/g.43083 Transcript_28494/m.43083 type:complete len:327 (-) Transcript_28494:139-1119(-)
MTESKKITEIAKTMRTERKLLEAASSSEDESNSDSDINEPTIVNSIDDLPSEDSVSLEDESESGDNCSSDEGFFEDNISKEEEVPLEDRLKSRRSEGIASDVLKNQRARKAAALQKAKERLKASSKQQISKSKHAPTEIPSTRKAYFQRGAPLLNNSGVGVTLKRYKSRDPRMSSMSGRLNEDHFEYHYQFLEDMREEEISALQKRIKARSVNGRKGQRLRKKLGLSAANAPSLEQDQTELKRLKAEQVSWERNKLERNAKRTVKRKIREQVESGEKGAYFLKRKELKKLKLEAKYEELKKKDGAIDKALTKRRKKNKTKDSRLMT